MSSEKTEQSVGLPDQPGDFPGTFVPDWVTLHPELNEGHLAIAQFVGAFRNPKSDDPVFVKRRTVYERFGHKRNWLDRRTDKLEEIGYLLRVPSYTDNITGQRTLDHYDANGRVNEQTSNYWLTNQEPPLGDDHPHPIRSAEYSHPDKIEKRIRERNRIKHAYQRRAGKVSNDQKTAGHTPGSTQHPPRVPHSTHPGFHTAPTPGSTQHPLEQNPPEQVPLEQAPLEQPSLRSGIVSVPKSPSVPSRNAREVDGTDESSTKSGAEKNTGFVASDLVHAPELRADLTRIDLLPARKTHQQSQHAQLVQAVDAALLRFPQPKVERYLRDKAHAANTVKWLITAFTTYSDAIADVPMPEHDHDEAAVEANLEQSLPDTAPWTLDVDAAPATPPSAPVTSGHSKETTRAPSGPVEPYQDATSPVEDLPDEVYAALSPAEKATVHAHAGTSWESLPSMAARQLRAIYDRVSAAA